MITQRPPARAPRTGGVLRIPAAGLGSLDPLEASTPLRQTLTAALFGTLTVWDPATLLPRPALAAGWQADAAQREWDFVLRPDARLGTGRALLASDVVFALSRATGAGVDVGPASALRVVRGYGAWHAGKATSLTGVSSAEPRVVHLSLESGMGELPSLLANPALGIVPPEAVGLPAGTETPPPGSRVTATPPGTGEFRIAGQRQGEVVSLERVPWSKAYVDRVEAVSYPDEVDAYDAFRRGGFDLAIVPPERLDDATRYHGATRHPLLAELFYGINARDPALADVRLRQAIVQAVDRRAIARGVYRGTALALGSYLVGGLSGLGRTGRSPRSGCVRDCGGDRAGARRLVRQVFGRALVPKLTLDYDDDPSQAAVARQLAANLRAVGISTEGRAQPLADFQSLVISGGGQLRRMGWVAAYPSAGAFLEPLFYSASPDNLTGLSSSEVDSLVGAAAREPDARRRTADWRRVELAVAAQAVAVPLVQFEEIVVRARRVGGLSINPVGTWSLEQVWLGS